MNEQDIVTLDAEQRERVKELLRQYKADELNTPGDLVDEWERPTTARGDRDFDSGTTMEYIDPTDIVGRLGSGAFHFEPHKAAQILVYLFEGEFDQLMRYPPTLEKRPEGFFVTNDGTHRSIVAKAIPLEELYVEYYTVPDSVLERK